MTLLIIRQYSEGNENLRYSKLLGFIRQYGLKQGYRDESKICGVANSDADSADLF